jgi:dynactin complex subunit
LVASRKINADQKAQILKKPSLQAQLAQLEEQIANYKKFDQEYKAKAQAEKAELEKTFTDKAAKELEEAVSATKEEAAATATKEQHDNLLLLSQFLRLAAARRAEDVDSTLDENMALEGVLVEVYSGDENAVATMAKLINGSDEQTSSVSGEKLNTTCKYITARYRDLHWLTLYRCSSQGCSSRIRSSGHCNRGNRGAGVFRFRRCHSRVSSRQ